MTDKEIDKQILFKTPVVLILFLAGLVSLGTTLWIGINVPWNIADRVAHSHANPAIVRDLAAARSYRKSRDWVAATKVLRPHLGSKDPDVLFQFAYLQSRGWGVERDLENARDLLLQAVSKPFAQRGPAAFELAKIYRISGGDDCHRIAYEWFHKALDWGYLKAHREIAKAHARGYGVTPDFEKAIYHFKRAADLGSAASIVDMIWLVRDGLGDQKPDAAEAARLVTQYLPILETYANHGDRFAARSLARIYIDGQLVEADLQSASKWLSEATKLGDATAMHELAMLAIKQLPELMSGEQILQLLRESAKRGYSAAHTAMARLHLNESFGLKPEGSVAWLKSGDALGHPGAMEELARLHLNGKYVEEDIEAAFALAKRGASLKHKGCGKLLRKISKKLTKVTPSSGAPTLLRKG